MKVNSYNPEYFYANPATAIIMVLLLILTISLITGGNTCLNLYRKHDRRELLNWASSFMALAIGCGGILASAPLILAAAEAEKVEGDVGTYIQTLGEQTATDILSIGEVKPGEEPDTSYATVSFVVGDDLMTEEMPVVLNPDDKQETYVTYKKLDKNPSQIISDRKIIGTYKNFRTGSLHDFTLHLSKNHNKTHSEEVNK